MKILVLVLGCRAAPYPELIAAIKRTWASVAVEDVDVLFYYGGETFEESGRDLFLPVPDDLAHVGEKTLACLDYVLAERDFDLVFRTNCSTYVDLPNLRKFADDHATTSAYYAGKGGSYDSIDFATGSGYFLSRDLVELVKRDRESWDHGHLDDVALGQLLGRHGVKRAFAPRAIVATVREAKRVDLAHFHFRCKSESGARRRDGDLMEQLHRRFHAIRSGDAPVGRTIPRPSWDPSPMVSRVRGTIGGAVRSVPGGPSLLALRRTVTDASARRRPVRPPLDYPGRVLQLSETPDDEAFLTGNGIAARCRFVLNYDVLKVNADVANNWWFCKAEFLEYFFADLRPDDEFVLFSHNSDRPIGAEFKGQLRRTSLLAWFAQNAVIHHPKLFALPIGIANPYWPHGDQAVLKAIQRSPPPKEILVDAAFDVSTNPSVREYCIEQTGLAPQPRVQFPDYLRRLASAYFCVSPAGNGVDTHRTWEALYLGTIPIVTKSVLTEQHPDLPMIVLEDWSEFRELDLSPSRYTEICAGWDPSAIRLDAYFARVADTLGARRKGSSVGRTAR